MVVVNVEPEYGYVVLAASATVVINFWQMAKIGSLRKKLGIKYPAMYSDKHPEFNCAQRVHQNTLEQLPFFIANLLLGGIRHPKLAALFGAVFLAGRVVYSLGYYTGDPSKRVPGGIMSTLGGIVPLFFLALSTGAGMLGWC